MSDNPFDTPARDDRTVIRPVPGGTASQRPVADREALPRPTAPLARPAEGTEDLAIGDSPLVAAAMPLLQLVTRLRNATTPPDAGDLRERAVQEMQGFERRARAAGVPVEQVRQAHYALCAALDDVVLNTPWGSSGAWSERSLVSTFHHEVRSGERFFVLLRELSAEPARSLPVLELMYLCMALGFVGQYRLKAHRSGEIDRVREETYSLIARNRPKAESLLSPNASGVVAPYRPGRVRLPVWVAGAAGLGLIGGLFVWLAFGLGGASDTLYARQLAAPPATMPAIIRAALARPVPVVPQPRSEPSAVDRFRQFLQPEINQGLVTVGGTPERPVVRIASRGMFASGSATLNPTFQPLLDRIGQALRSEPGRVRLIGYTDNIPIRTIAFPSNYQLSEARAKAAAAAIVGVLGPARRVDTEARGEADPIASNATPEGREQNRRIELVLDRMGG